MAKGNWKFIASVKHRLKRWPKLYHAFQNVFYYGLQFIERQFLGTKIHELRWRMHRIEGTDGCSPSHPHRAFLIERIGKFAPSQSILEVGCGGGENLAGIGRAYPGVQLYGIDINERAIKVTKERLQQECIRNADCFIGRADDLSRFTDKSVDIVLTDACLMYLGPDRIMRAILEIVRVARRGCILNEWGLLEGNGTSLFSRWDHAHWVHDFRGLFSGIVGVKTVSLERLPQGLWGSGGWDQYGVLVQVGLWNESGDTKSQRCL